MPSAIRKNVLSANTQMALVEGVLPEILIANSLLANSIGFSRGMQANVIDPEGRDLDAECGYPIGPIPLQAYDKMYQRGGIASRVVNVYPDECWSSHPELYEVEDGKDTPFEKAWKKLNQKVNCWHYLHRADRLSGIAQFGVILIGLNDGKPLNEPASFDEKMEITFVRVFQQSQVFVTTTIQDDKDPRYGDPELYQILLSDPSLIPLNAISSAGSVIGTRTDVHWTRVIHLADNRLSSEIYGLPRMEQVYNYIFDVRKVGGGSGEMFWRGAFPGYSFETFPEFSNEVDVDQESVKEQFKLWSNGLQRYMALQGMTVKSLAPQVADPGPHLEWLLNLLCATIGVPLRIFLGSEAGHLASSQDSETWNKRLALRQQDYVTPMVIRPFVDRLISLGVLPEPEEYHIQWKDLNTLKDTDKADIGIKRTQALLQYVTSGAETLLPFREWLINFMLYPVAEAEAMAAAGEKVARKIKTKQVWDQQAGNTSASSVLSPAKKTGAAGNTNSQGASKK
jgi:hypothetical protein